MYLITTKIIILSSVYRTTRPTESNPNAIYPIGTVRFTAGTISVGVVGRRASRPHCARARAPIRRTVWPTDAHRRRTVWPTDAHCPRTLRTACERCAPVGRNSCCRPTTATNADKCRMITRFPYPLFDPAVAPDFVSHGFLSVVGNWQFIVPALSSASFIHCRRACFRFFPISSVNIRAHRPPPWWWFPTPRNWSACEYNVDNATRHVNERSRELYITFFLFFFFPFRPCARSRLFVFSIMFLGVVRSKGAAVQQQNRSMATLKQIQMRLKSVTNIQKITQSMKMVSAAKYARAERELRQARPYGEGVKV